MSETEDRSARSVIFVCYSHRDARWCERLAVHLCPIENVARVDRWDDSRIVAGSRWRDEIRDAIERAKVAILLVSADFVASKFIRENELVPLLHAAKKGATRVIPVHVGPSNYDTIEALADLQAFNAPSAPLMKLSRAAQEEALKNVAADVLAIVKRHGTPSPEARTSGNGLGAASGPLAFTVDDVHKIYAATNNKSILMCRNPSISELPFEKLAGLIIAGPPLGDTSHLHMLLIQRGIPTVYVDELPSATPGASTRIDANVAGKIEDAITFSKQYIEVRERDYYAAVSKNLTSGGGVPKDLISLLTVRNLPAPPPAMLAWALTWGPVHEIIRNLLPQMARAHFPAVAEMCERLCSEYQWPIGRQEARRVLPQMLYYRRSEAMELISRWLNSSELHLVKSAAMVLGNVAVVDRDAASTMLKRVMNDPNETVSKEAMRALPILAEFAPDLASTVAERFRQRDLLDTYKAASFYGLNLSAIPAFLAVDNDLAFQKIEEAIRIICSQGISDQNLNMARNYIFAHLLLLGEAHEVRARAILDKLRLFAGDRFIQVDLLVAASRLCSVQPALARECYGVAVAKLDPSLVELARSIENPLQKEPLI